LLGQVPLISAIRAGGDSGKPVTVTDPEGLAGKVFRDISESLLARLAKPLPGRPSA
jgi:ATP-binding protein involved in chromosome partitioning